MTGTFDDWSKSEKLLKTGNSFSKDVALPNATEKIYYKVRGGEPFGSDAFPWRASDQTSRTGADARERIPSGIRGSQPTVFCMLRKDCEAYSLTCSKCCV